jgi:hypothetical protein
MNGLKRQVLLARKPGEERPYVPVQGRIKTSKYKFLKALAGTGGNRREIAERLRINVRTVQNLIRRPDWTDVAEKVLEEERAINEVIVSDAIRGLLDSINQRADLGVCSTSSRWALSKLRRNLFGDDSKLVVDGGANPIKMLQVQVPAEILNQPLEVQKEVLAALEKLEERQRKLVESQVAKPQMRFTG